MAYFVYIVRCRNGAYYTGIARDVKRRVADHNRGKGAKYTRAFGPVRLLWFKKMRTRPAALRLEARIKRLSRLEKRAYIQSARRKPMPRRSMG